LKITKGRLVEIIKEEIDNSILQENSDIGGHFLDHPDDEGGMMLSQINKVGAYAAKLADQIKDDEQYPSWVQAKLTLASDYMRAVSDWMDKKVNDPRPPSREDDESYRKERFMAP
tara:strand:+ start:1787 stop:2131 length:345 start_codon:yes stop_codon:yes gene_type:complete